MKKLNNYILFPLILGSVCIISSGILGTLDYFLKGNSGTPSEKDPIIYEMYGGEEKVSEILPLTEEFDYIDKASQVTLASGDVTFVYKVTTPKGYVGKITYYISFDSSKTFENYKFIEGTEDGMGKDLMSSTKTIKTFLANYVPGTPIDTITGSTLKETPKAFKLSLDQVFDDLKTRTVVSNIDKNVIALFAEADFVKAKKLSVSDNTIVNDAYEVTLTNDKVAYAYKVTTPKGYIGKVTYYIAYDSNKQFINYAFSSSTEDSMGTEMMKSVKSIKNLLATYVEGSVIDSIAGSTLKETPKAFKISLDAVFADLGGRISGK